MVAQRLRMSALLCLALRRPLLLLTHQRRSHLAPLGSNADLPRCGSPLPWPHHRFGVADPRRGIRRYPQSERSGAEAHRRRAAGLARQPPDAPAIPAGEAEARAASRVSPAWHFAGPGPERRLRTSRARCHLCVAPQNQDSRLGTRLAKAPASGLAALRCTGPTQSDSASAHSAPPCRERAAGRPELARPAHIGRTVGGESDRQASEPSSLSAAARERASELAVQVLRGLPYLQARAKQHAQSSQRRPPANLLLLWRSDRFAR